MKKQTVGKIATALLVAAVGTTFSSGAANAGPLLDLGALFQFTGTGASAGINGSIYDGAIHSGSSRDVCASPSGGCANPPGPVLSDSYVLQGGDPYGGDTGDAFEESQAVGHATISSFFDVFTHYVDSSVNPPCTVQAGTCIIGGPDTGYLEFVNNSGSIWTGIITLSGLSGAGPFFINSGAVSLAANGGLIDIVLNNESSNFGGYNPVSVPEPSVLALLGVAFVSLFGFGLVRRRASA